MICRLYYPLMDHPNANRRGVDSFTAWVQSARGVFLETTSGSVIQIRAIQRNLVPDSGVNPVYIYTAYSATLGGNDLAEPDEMVLLVFNTATDSLHLLVIEPEGCEVWAKNDAMSPKAAALLAETLAQPGT